MGSHNFTIPVFYPRLFGGATPRSMYSMKMYYDDPLKAAYMAREFGVKYEEIYPAITYSFKYNDIASHRGGNKYIHPDSHSIFEPREDDTVVLDELGVHSFEDVGELYDGKQEIILRDGKHFFMAEVEDNQTDGDGDEV